MKDQLSDFIEIINNAKDVINGGWKTEHESVTIGCRPGASSGTDSLELIAAEILSCVKCNLSKTRHHPLPGTGVINPVVMFIGEGPEPDEDKTGESFVGRAGEYLDKWLDAIGLERNKNCFVGNIIKCRPPENRDPHPDEITACQPFLLRQLVLIKPTIIVTLGRFASQVICGSDEGIEKLRRRVHQYEGIPVVPTYHPSSVLRNKELRGAVWSDLKRVKELADEIGRRN
ncbi:MAG: uracil-DNA glycosylase [Spirochaetales bacterium]|nr:uracil-DNA glycosylase [Spirochaetales bacterium]